jgi:hypothetical protein
VAKGVPAGARSGHQRWREQTAAKPAPYQRVAAKAKALITPDNTKEANDAAPVAANVDPAPEANPTKGDPMPEQFWINEPADAPRAPLDVEAMKARHEEHFPGQVWRPESERSITGQIMDARDAWRKENDLLNWGRNHPEEFPQARVDEAKLAVATGVRDLRARRAGQAQANDALNHGTNDSAPTGARSSERGGPNMSDLTSAPKVLTQWAELYEHVHALVDGIGVAAQAVSTTADGMGDFAIGGEGDVAGAVQQIHAQGVAAREALAAYIVRLNAEYQASIEAAAAKQAAAHRPMQEA